jgi:adenylate kinase
MTDEAWIGLTGTPGTGKTTVAHLLNECSVYSVSELSKQHGCLGEIDSHDMSREIDIDSLNNSLEKQGINLQLKGSASSCETVIIEGHLSHLLPVSAIVILRCEPDILHERLNSRNWSSEKIRENTEWELMVGPWIELVNHKNNDLPIIEIDGSDNSPEEIVQIIEKWLKKGLPLTSFAEIDWMKKVVDN